MTTVTRELVTCPTCDGRVFLVSLAISGERCLVDEEPSAVGTLELLGHRTADGVEIVQTRGGSRVWPGSDVALVRHASTCAPTREARDRGRAVEQVKAFLAQGMSRHRPIVIGWSELEDIAASVVELARGSAS